MRLFFLKKNTVIDNHSQPAPKTDNQIEGLELEIAYLRGIQSAMPDPYYIRDMEYKIVAWPDAIAKLMGYSETEAKKLKCYDIFKASVCPPHVTDCVTQECIKTRQFLKNAAVDVYHKNGSIIHALVSNAGIYGKNGNQLGAVEIVKDNTLLKSSMDSIGHNISDIESASDSLTAVIEQVNAASNKVNENAGSTLDSIKTGVKAGGSVNEKAGHSTEYAGNVQSGMQTISSSMQFSMEKISALKEKTESISQFVSVIQDISSKTNLLAINASIEAAHAGESGRGFKVVADGIRELSKNSNESAQSIKTIINEVSTLVKEATMSLGVTGKNIESGRKDISELLSFFKEIDDAAKVLMDILSGIESAASASSALGLEQTKSVAEMNKVGKNLSNIAKRLADEVISVMNQNKM